MDSSNLEVAVNINYEIPDDLHRALKVKAAQEGKTLKALIIELLQAAVLDEEPREEQK